MSLHYILTGYLLVVTYIYSAYNQSTEITKPIAKKVYLVLTLGVMCFFTALRHYSIGNDTPSYKIIFDEISRIGLDFSYRVSVEPGFKVINFVLTKMTNNFQWLVIISSVFVYISIANYLYKRCENLGLGVVFVYCLMYRTLMSMMRQSISLAIILFAIILLDERKIVKYYLLVFFAVTIHYSAAIFLIYPFIGKFKLTKWKTVASIAISFIVAQTDILFKTISLLHGRFSSYIESTEGGISLIFEALLYLSFIIIGRIFMDRNYLSADEDIDISNSITKSQMNYLMWASLLCILFNIMSFKVSGLTRLTKYFHVMACTFVINMLSIRRTRTTQLLAFAYIVLMVVYYTVTLVYRPDWNRIYPYMFFWQQR